jgi:hypothetical protein
MAAEKLLKFPVAVNEYVLGINSFDGQLLAGQTPLRSTRWISIRQDIFSGKHGKEPEHKRRGINPLLL